MCPQNIFLIFKFQLLELSSKIHFLVVWVLEENVGQRQSQIIKKETEGYLECSTGLQIWAGVVDCLAIAPKTTITPFLFPTQNNNFQKFSVSLKIVASTLVVLISLPVCHASSFKVGVTHPYGYLKSHTKRLLVLLHFQGDIEISKCIRLLLATL